MNLFVSLKYLIALDDHRHFGRAALACHVTQPALSNALRALETNFGTSIVKRGRNFAGFTPEGERVLVSARRIVREQELLRQDLESHADTPRGQLHIGAVPTAMPIAARFAAMLQDCHPGIEVTLRSLSSVELETGLESLALDMGLGYAERGDSGSAHLRVVPQYTEHYYLLRKQPPLAKQEQGTTLSWAEAATLPLCLLSAEMHNRTIVDRAFREAGCRVNPAIETNSTMTLVLSVVAGRVCSVLPGALLETTRGYPDLQLLPLTDPQVAIPIAFLVHDTNRPSRTLEAALAFAKDPVWLDHAARHSGLWRT
jgi:DNA-binding transcriptional LysR family regulator